jgi:hypothetical protein
VDSKGTMATTPLTATGLTTSAASLGMSTTMDCVLAPAPWGVDAPGGAAGPQAASRSSRNRILKVRRTLFIVFLLGEIA